MIVLMIYYDLCIAPTTTLGSSRNAILLPFYRSCLPIQTTIPGMPRFLQSNGSTETSVTFGFPSSKHEKRSRMQPGGGSTREAVGGFEQALQKDLWWCGLGHPEALPKRWVQRNLQLLCFTLKGYAKYAKVSFPTLKTHLTPPKSSRNSENNVNSSFQTTSNSKVYIFSHFLCRMYVIHIDFWWSQESRSSPGVESGQSRSWPCGPCSQLKLIQGLSFNNLTVR